jgi:hypothetical protein
MHQLRRDLRGVASSRLIGNQQLRSRYTSTSQSTMALRVRIPMSMATMLSSTRATLCARPAVLRMAVGVVSGRPLVMGDGPVDRHETQRWRREFSTAAQLRTAEAEMVGLVKPEGLTSDEDGIWEKLQALEPVELLVSIATVCIHRCIYRCVGQFEYQLTNRSKTFLAGVGVCSPSRSHQRSFVDWEWYNNIGW